MLQIQLFLSFPPKEWLCVRRANSNVTAVTNRTGTAYSSQNFKFIYIIIIKLYINMADNYNKNDIQMT